MISFGVSDNELPDLLPLSASCNARLSAAEELIRVMTKAVNELGLEWSQPEEPSRSMLDEWFLPGRHQALCQRSSPFFPEAHDELTKSWRGPYSDSPASSYKSTLGLTNRTKGPKRVLGLNHCNPRASEYSR